MSDSMSIVFLGDKAIYEAMEQLNSYNYSYVPCNIESLQEMISGLNKSSQTIFIINASDGLNKIKVCLDHIQDSFSHAECWAINDQKDQSHSRVLKVVGFEKVINTDLSSHAAILDDIHREIREFEP